LQDVIETDLPTAVSLLNSLTEQVCNVIRWTVLQLVDIIEIWGESMWRRYDYDDTCTFSGCFSNKSCSGYDKESQRESASDF